MKNQITENKLLGKTFKESFNANKGVKELQKLLTKSPTDNWLSKKEAAEYIGLSQRQLDRYRTKGIIKSYQPIVNGKVRFKKRDLDNFLNIK